MGLAVVHGIVKSYDGMISFQSKPGQGTVFNVFFPIIKQGIQQEIEQAGPLPTGNEKILIVDDDKVVALLMKRRVERFGYQVTSKTSSQEALDLFRSKPDYFDLVITDQIMPELTGDQLAVKIMKIRPGFPIIICTGYSSRMDDKKANRLGISAFLTKPVERVEFAKTIRRVLDQKQLQ